VHTRARPYARVAGELAGTAFSQIDYVLQTGSTNADAAALLGSEKAHGLSVVAEHQTAGSGRKGRTWHSLPQTSLLVTTILPRAIPAGVAWSVPFWTALAVRDALLDCGVPTLLHWPNDLLISNDRKLAGILCVSRITGDTAWVACGVGVNVRRPPTGAIAIDPPAAYCDDVTAVDRAALLLAILRRYDASLNLLADPAEVARRWELAAGLPGVRYRIVRDADPRPFEAIGLRLSGNGGLIVERDGQLKTIALADARALR
jgi:BirA family biotin operon repressor/biotin-[acetyl-CoA-carboxylase] ligase